MQKPRLTQRTAEALTDALPFLVSQYEEIWGDESWPREQRDNMKRAIEYLEDLLRWKRTI